MNDLINGVDRDLKLKLLDIKDVYSEETEYMIRFLDDNNLKFDKEGIEKYIEYLKTYIRPKKKKRYAPRTINKRIACIKNRLKYIFDNLPPEYQDRVSEYKFKKYLNTFKYVKLNSIAVDKERILTDKEIQKLIDNADTRLGLMITFLADTRVRVGELINILAGDFVKKKDHIEVGIKGKGEKYRSVPISFELFNQIKREFDGQTYLFEHSGKQYSKRAITIRISILAERVLGKHKTAHDFRHTLATKLLKKYTLGSTAKFLGHTDPACTARIYDNNVISFSDLKKVIKRIGS